MDIKEQIFNGKVSIGIEFGSTRIKAVLTGQELNAAAVGTYDWENKLENGIWTYSQDDIINGLKGVYASLREDVERQYGVKLDKVASIGISAMMHGYLAFDENDNLLVPFRTWRNTMTAEAADELTEVLGFNIPQRWSIAHLWQAILNKEPHVPKIRFFTTLAGYVHMLLTGQKVLGIGDASGMFPIGADKVNYDKDMIAKFDELSAKHGFTRTLGDILPHIIPVGECAGQLTNEGALILDPTGTLKSGIPFCPPEGDAGTGMVATNSIRPRTGNVSAGTSIFTMAVLEKPLSAVYREIDIVTTPCGDSVAMVHCNNCTTDLDAWVKMIGGTLEYFGVKIPKPELYDKLYESALSGDPDCGGLFSCNYFSGEHVTGLTQGRPLLVRTPEASFNISNLMRTLIYSCISTLRSGMSILTEKEAVGLDRLTAHGGLFKTPEIGQSILAAALNVPTTVMESAGEGGAWGIAILAAYMVQKDRREQLCDFLSNRVFAKTRSITIKPDKKDIDGFAKYMDSFAGVLEVEKTAVNSL